MRTTDDAGMTITLIDTTDGKPLYQTHYTDRAAGGIQRLDLAKEGSASGRTSNTDGDRRGHARRPARRVARVDRIIKMLPAGDP